MYNYKTYIVVIDNINCVGLFSTMSICGHLVVYFVFSLTFSNKKSAETYDPELNYKVCN